MQRRLENLRRIMGALDKRALGSVKAGHESASTGTGGYPFGDECACVRR
jgi:hypothetical protein